ncbi:MAG: hypothetical protein IJ681_03485 [Bacteroidales bacterium]|nr:hypothetical protein [Bacteroidales bacterium]
MTNELLDYLTSEEREQLSHCTLCPRKCGADRLHDKKGFCNLGVSLSTALIINHKGEEPILSKDKGITNVFFSHCNCQCIFCQNYKISSNKTEPKNLYPTMEEVIDRIISVLSTSENVLGFVSATHQIPVMKAIIRELHKRRCYPKIVYNCGGYESVESLQELEDWVDVYLPDWKYADNELAQRYSSAPGYNETVISAVKEMYRQKGSSILTDINENIESGLIIRHLVLPEQLENSKKVLDEIAWEISSNITLSLMSQYNPPFVLPYSDLNRKITQKEYNEVLDFALESGFHKIFTQDLGSTDSVIPDFDNNTFVNNN